MNKEQAERYIKKYMPKTYNRVKDLQSQLAYANSRIEDGALYIKGYQEELDKARARIEELEDSRLAEYPYQWHLWAKTADEFSAKIKCLLGEELELPEKQKGKSK